MSLVHGMLAGADSIDDMNVLRAGSTGLVLGHRVMAPRRWGRSCGRSRSGMSASSTMSWTIAARAWEAGAGPGERPLVIDIDSFIGEVHGYQKQGASYGYTKQARLSPDGGGPRRDRRGAAYP